jgi:hypothetical protein
MTGAQLATFTQELNGGASIGDTLLFQLLNLAKAMVEQRRPWMILRDTDTSKTLSAGNNWQTAIDLSTIARFNRFYGDEPIKNFDGSNRIEYLHQVPFQKRLEYKEAYGTFVFKESTKTLYINGLPTFAGTLWIDHIKDSPDIEENTEWVFPSWSHALLGFYAVGIHKGGIDFDDVNARMSADNRGQAALIMQQLENWDSELQLNDQTHHDPTFSEDPGYRPNAINIRR